tara:strand:+ start:1583 stop:2998 length:1416 start_codon:yes stop_codon:yes gene_type:complete
MSNRRIKMTMPDALVILFFVALLAALAAWLVPAGSFQINPENQAIEPGSFSYETSEKTDLPLFAEKGEIGLANVAFEGLVSGTKWGSAIGVIAFILIVGGSFGIVLKTAAIEHGVLNLIQKTQRFDRVFLVTMFLMFSLAGAIFGMGEEAIAFCLVLYPVMRSLGYNAATTVLITYVATQIGFATSWMSPFSVAIAQGIAEVPLMSGASFRMVTWLIFTLVGLIFTLRYAERTKDTQARSEAALIESKFGKTDSAILSVFFIGLIWVIWGVTARAYYIPEIAAQFFVIGICVGIIAIIAGRLSANGVARAFNQGAQDLLPAALIVGFAKGLVLLLGGDDPSQASTLNTLLYHASELIGDASAATSASLMLLFQSVFNFFIASGSGQAALTMPLMAPLSDLVEVSRQVAVLAFQLGDGLTNIIIPTSASLIGCLGAVKLDWSEWIKIIWRFQLVIMTLALITVITAVSIGFN